MKRTPVPDPLPPPETRRRTATAYDVARLAGVSQLAVSRAFTEGASIAEPTRLKVVEAARQLGYRPNLIARSLITRRSHIVGVAMGYFQNPFYPAVLDSLSRAFAANGYRVLLFTTDPDTASDPILEEVLRYKLDALILVSATLSSHFDEECQAAGIPVVLLNRKTESATVSSVTGDNRDGARAVASFLIAGGHRHYAFMAGAESSSTSRDRETGFTDHLLSQGVAAPQRWVGNYDFDTAARAARAMFSAEDRPDAVFCANDHMALAVLNVERAEFGLQVGRDVSIVGFDDIGPSAWPLADLTTYAQPIAAMVDRVVAIVQRQLGNSPGPAVEEVLAGKLIIRGSARLPG